MRTGRPPKALEQHRLDDTRTRRRTTASKTGITVAGRRKLVAPAWMSESQAAAFAELAESQAKVLDAADGPMVEAAAVLLDRARAASAAVAESLRIPNRFGHDEPDPMLRVERDAWSSFRQFAEQLGVGPSARARLAGLGEQGQVPDDALDGVATLKVVG